MNDNDFTPEPTSTGIKLGRLIIGYSAVIRSLDSGSYDRSTSKSLKMLDCIMEAKENGWMNLSIEQEVILWRWLVATVFMNEEMKKNGTIDIPNDYGGVDRAVIYTGQNGAISIYPAPERFALANNVEGLAIEKYGREMGLSLALRVYQDMVTKSHDGGLMLSAMGREGLGILHDSFIEQIQTEGMPGMPVVH